MVTKWSPGGEFAGGWRSTSKSICSSGMNSDRRECFLWGLCKPAQIDLDAQRSLQFRLHQPSDVLPTEVYWSEMHGNGQSECRFV